MSEDKVTLYKQKDLEEKLMALATIEKEYPEMTKLREMLRGDRDEFRRQYPIQLIACASRALKIPASGITIMGGKPYVNKTGLTNKVQHDPRRVSRIESYPVILPIKITNFYQPQMKEPAHKYFLGVSDDGTAIYKGVVEFEDGSVFSDEGTANAKYLNKDWNKMSTMIPYVMELASTRATNRAMRLATGIGLVSIEELNERGYTLIKENIGKDVSGKKIELINNIEAVFKKRKYNDATIQMICRKFGGVDRLENINEENLERLYFSTRSSEKKAIKKKISRKKKEKKKTKRSARNEGKKIVKKSKKRK